MNKEQLQVKYPKFPAKSDPAPSCPVCRGSGEFVNGVKQTHICMCACLSGEEKLRVKLVEMFQQFVHSTLTELRTRPREVK